jgi:hypothetical protein
VGTHIVKWCYRHACVSAQIEEGKDETDAGLLLTGSTKEQPTIGKVPP